MAQAIQFLEQHDQWAPRIGIDVVARIMRQDLLVRMYPRHFDLDYQKVALLIGIIGGQRVDAFHDGFHDDRALIDARWGDCPRCDSCHARVVELPPQMPIALA
jgi:hypothetical protein